LNIHEHHLFSTMPVRLERGLTSNLPATVMMTCLPISIGEPLFTDLRKSSAVMTRSGPENEMRPDS
jgi:hypothetical protein